MAAGFGAGAELLAVLEMVAGTQKSRLKKMPEKAQGPGITGALCHIRAMSYSPTHSRTQYHRG